MNLLIRLLLAVHLCGLVIMAGTTVVDYLTYKTFCSLVDAGDVLARGLLSVMARYGSLVRAGAGILLLSGIIMVVLNNAWLGETWFKVKLALVIILVLNGAFIGNGLGMKFRKIALCDITLVQQNAKIRTELNWFYIIQLILFLLIILVTTIRPGRY